MLDFHTPHTSHTNPYYSWSDTNPQRKQGPGLDLPCLRCGLV